MQATANISKALSIGGWMSEEELLWLANQAHKHLRIVEFGCFHGRSTRALADNNTHGGIWAVDPWAGVYFTEGKEATPIDTYVMPIFLRNLKDHIETGHVVPCRMFSYQFRLPHFVEMVFIDGDHRYETVKKDINKALELLAHGGLISGHDYDHPGWPGVKQAVDELLGPVEVMETIWYTTKP